MKFKVGDMVTFLGNGDDFILSCYLLPYSNYTVTLVFGDQIIVEGHNVTQSEFSSHFVLLNESRKEKLLKLKNI